MPHETTMRKNSQIEKFNDRIVFMCPPSLPIIIDRAASERLMNRSDYIRQAVIDRLYADGILPTVEAGNGSV